MAYITVKTVGTGDPWTANDMNTYVRANFAAGVPDIFTAAGDLVSASAADVGVVLPVSAINDSILMVNHTNPGKIGWRTPAAARAYCTLSPSNYPIPGNGVYAQLKFNAEAADSGFDTDGKQSVAAGTAWKFQAPRTGYYLVAVFALLGNSDGTAGIAWSDQNKSFLVHLLIGVSLESTMAIKKTQVGDTYKSGVPGIDIIYLVKDEQLYAYGEQYSGSDGYMQGQYKSHISVKYLGS